MVFHPSNSFCRRALSGPGPEVFASDFCVARSIRKSPLPVLFHLAIHRDRNISLTRQVAELDYLVSLPRELSPSTWLLPILFNRLVLPPIHHKPDSSKS